MLNALYRVVPDAHSIYANEVDWVLRSGILRYPMTDNIFGRADKFMAVGLTGYDACYVALAEELDGIWLTFDAKACRLLDDDELAMNLNEINPVPTLWYNQHQFTHSFALI